VITLVIIKSSAAGIAKDVTTAVSNHHDANSAFVTEVRNRAIKLREELLKWRSDHKTVLGPRITNICSSSTDIEGERRCRIIGVYLPTRILSNRLLEAVCPWDRKGLEQETQWLVKQAFELIENVRKTRPHALLFLAQAMALASATKETEQEWLSCCGDIGGDAENTGKVIDLDVFESWCSLFDRILV
jgi:hypothetical protein